MSLDVDMPPPLLKPNIRKKGTLIIKGVLRNLVNFEGFEGFSTTLSA